MNLEFQKSIILLSVIAILFCLYISNLFDRNSPRENNYILFSILIFSCFLALIQIRKIKNWQKEDKTDYYLVYNLYLLFTCLVFMYCSYIIVTRSKLECFKILSDNLDIMCIKLSNSIKQQGGVSDVVSSTINIYTNIWKKMLFL